jgi:alcohol dehydrogenase YqhD (iron-dependent ADH family)
VLNFTYQNPTRILFGKGQLQHLGTETRKWGTNALVVSGKGSAKRTGLYSQALTLLNDAGVRVVELAGIDPNPRISSVREGAVLCREHKVDVIIAIGGGSTIDAAKAIAAAACYQGDPWDFFSSQATIREALPLGAVLTLAATGSEANGNMVITNWETHEKVGMGSPHLFPRFSILDPTLTFTVPANQTAYGAADIMAHVFEQYFHPTPATPLQDRFCESILRTVVENLPIALQQPDNYDARANLMWCSTMALNTLIGMGVDDDWACHAIEHELSGIYDIPHGAGLAIVFPHWMRYVWKAHPKKFAQYAVQVWDEPAAGRSDEELALAGIRHTEEFFLSAGVPVKLNAWNIGHERLAEAAARATARGPIGSLKPLEAADVEAILKMCLS